MEEIRNAIYNDIDIVTERNYHIIDQLTKLEIQSKEAVLYYRMREHLVRRYI